MKEEYNYANFIILKSIDNPLSIPVGQCGGEFDILIVRVKYPRVFGYSYVITLNIRYYHVNDNIIGYGETQEHPW